MLTQGPFHESFCYEVRFRGLGFQCTTFSPKPSLQVMKAVDSIIRVLTMFCLQGDGGETGEYRLEDFESRNWGSQYTGWGLQLWSFEAVTILLPMLEVKPSEVVVMDIRQD